MRGVLVEGAWSGGGDGLFRAGAVDGGAGQVRRTIIAERVLGLPREPKGVV
ncbi:hypothetical protein ACIHJG_09195 [Streptomyces sp. NPDC052415]|uniref:hypothetical protein n=1 Tax=Streptomyces sp. NPDC052415 TaxID=3365690 RepID=UPI0037CCEE96